VLCLPRERLLELLEICEAAFTEEHTTQTGLEAGQDAQAVNAAYGRF
jgi:hypothetical protein